MDRPRRIGQRTIFDGDETTGIAQADIAPANDLIAFRVITQSLETVVAVLAASREGVSINAAAKASGINYRTA